MNVLLLSIVVAAVGVDFGWERLPEGGSQYIIQLSPATLDALRDGRSIESFVMPAAGEVRSFRIVVGDAEPVREPPLESPPNPLLPPATAEPIAERRANYTLPQQPPPAVEEKSLPEPPAKPWLPFTLTLFGLFASLGTNVYLGWLSWELRSRRRAELAEENLPFPFGRGAEG
ncbi:MAG: hypothetical protein JW959_07570 [Pirellulales bacterium]|nr:hypothetical protein [Pirellulales bacterium]